MTTTNTRPAHTGFPDPERPKKVEGIQLQLVQVNKNLSHVSNSNQTLRRHTLISHEHLSQDVKSSKNELLKKDEEILSHQDEISDQIAEVHTDILEAQDRSDQNHNEAFNHLNQKLSVISDQLNILLQKK